MEMRAEIQNEKVPASMTVCSLVLCCAIGTEAKLTDEGPVDSSPTRGLLFDSLFFLL